MSGWKWWGVRVVQALALSLFWVIWVWALMGVWMLAIVDSPL